MCDNHLYGVKIGEIDPRPSVRLANLLARYMKHGSIGSESVREMIRDDWSKLCALAHQVHDEENSDQKKLERAAVAVSRLDSEGLMIVVNGNGHPEVVENFKLLARKALGIK